MSAAAVQQLNGLKNEYSLLVEKLQEMEMEAEEHAVVLGALKPLDGARKCHRMVGGVLVERSVAEVIPALQKNHAGIMQAVEGLKRALQAKEEEIVKLQK